jgi:hypothetical protein
MVSNFFSNPTQAASVILLAIAVTIMVFGFVYTRHVHRRLAATPLLDTSTMRKRMMGPIPIMHELVVTGAEERVYAGFWKHIQVGLSYMLRNNGILTAPKPLGSQLRMGPSHYHEPSANVSPRDVDISVIVAMPSPTPSTTCTPHVKDGGYTPTPEVAIGSTFVRALPLPPDLVPKPPATQSSDTPSMDAYRALGRRLALVS